MIAEGAVSNELSNTVFNACCLSWADWNVLMSLPAVLLEWPKQCLEVDLKVHLRQASLSFDMIGHTHTPLPITASALAASITVVLTDMQTEIPIVSIPSLMDAIPEAPVSSNVTLH